MAEVVLAVSHLRKQLGGRAIIKDITFEVMAGEVFGFLGPNGAGKTTTIRMLVGLIAADGGDVKIGGYSLTSQFNQAISQVGCIVENPEMYKFLSGRENLQLLARMSGNVSEERIDEVVEFVGLRDAIEQKVKTYSLGMRQRLGIAQALLHQPSILILDEPTNGLDPAGIRELRQFIRRLAEEEGLAVFISSHLLSEIEMMCDRVAIINEGQVISVGHVETLMDQFGQQVEWQVASADQERAIALLDSLPYVEEVWLVADGILKCKMDLEHISQANSQLVTAGVSVQGIANKTATLEDLFLTLTGGGQNGR